MSFLKKLFGNPSSTESRGEYKEEAALDRRSAFAESNNGTAQKSEPTKDKYDESTPVVIDIAKTFIKLVREIEPKWNKAYFRFRIQESDSETKGSYVHGNEVELISVFKHRNFFDSIDEKGRNLMAILGNAEGVFLLTVNSNNAYEINFEYKDMNRWKIDKLDGGTGIPEGVER